MLCHHVCHRRGTPCPTPQRAQPSRTSSCLPAVGVGVVGVCRGGCGGGVGWGVGRGRGGCGGVWGGAGCVRGGGGGGVCVWEGGGGGGGEAVGVGWGGGAVGVGWCGGGCGAGGGGGGGGAVCPPVEIHGSVACRNYPTASQQSTVKRTSPSLSKASQQECRGGMSKAVFNMIANKVDMCCHAACKPVTGMLGGSDASAGGRPLRRSELLSQQRPCRCVAGR